MEINSVSPALDKCESNGRKSKVSKFRNYASQIYAASATNIVKLSSGSTAGFTSVLVAKLDKDDAGIHVSVSDLSWFGSYCFMAPVGCLCLGALSQRVGSRSAMLTSMAFHAASFLTFHFATTPGALLAAQALAGFFGPVSVGPGVNYVVEIAQPQLRGALTASTTLSMMSGAFLIVLLSNFLHWRAIALVMLVFPVAGFVAVCTIPESPHWLASKGKFHEARNALRWLRGWSSCENVRTELNKLKETHANSPGNSDPANSGGTPPFKSHLNAYSRRSFYVPLSLSCLLFALHHCTGFAVVATYCIVIFGRVEAPVDPRVAASVFDATRILGALVCIVLIYRTGKKRLVSVSLIGAALSFFAAATALLLAERRISPETCRWVAAIALVSATFSTSAGIDKVVFIMNAELFPTRHRGLGTGIGLFTGSVGGAVMSKIFLSLVDAVTLPGVFAVFGISCVVTCATFHLIFPETEGKTLQEIEEHYRGVGCLEKRVKADASVATEMRTFQLKNATEAIPIT